MAVVTVALEVVVVVAAVDVSQAPSSFVRGVRFELAGGTLEFSGTNSTQALVKSKCDSNTRSGTHLRTRAGARIRACVSPAPTSTPASAQHRTRAIRYN
ncbi:unnamed protein product [Taenia asiatica]|uniref:Secreted protein n=1 Tax=Taenia asiatica TaxID=60517 RepID=A0A0R3WFV2_TAEAS|nr:unnamed protein product [Taenia asiatica]